MSPPALVLLADDHPLVVSALSSLLDREPGLEVVGHVRSFAELWDALDDTSPHVLVLDIGMPGGHAIDALRRLRKRYPDVASSS